MKIGLQLKSIKSQITLSVVMVIALVCIGLALIADFIITSGVRKDTNNSMQVIVKQSVNLFNSRINEHYSVLNGLARVKLFQDFWGNQAEIMALLRQVAADRGYYDMTVADTHGRGFNSKVKDLQLPMREYLIKAIHGENAISDPMVSKAAGTVGKLIVVQAVPIRNSQNKVIGILGLSRNGNTLSKLVADINFGKSGKAFIVNREGTFMAHYDLQKVVRGENIINAAKKDSSLQSMAAAIQKMTDGKEGLGEYKYHGDVNYLAYHPVPGTNWSLGLTAPKSEVFGTLHRMQRIIALFSFIFLTVGGLISFQVALQISAPIQAMVNVVKHVAMGDLTKTLKIEKDRGFFKGTQEFGQLVDGFNYAIDNLRNLIGNINEQAKILTTASEKLKDTSNESGKSATEVANAIEYMAKASAEQTVQINQTVENITSLGDLVKKVSNDSQKIADFSKNVATSAQEGQKVSISVLSDIETLYNNTKELSSIIEGINQSSERIKETSSLIKGIAEQTTLLALNAAIEAARAGEQGKGFSVVANETGKLAEQSKQSSSEINKVIIEMIDRSVNAAETIQKAVTQFEKSKNLIVQDVSTFENIFTQLTDTFTRIQEVALSAQKMAEHNDQVISAASSIAAINEENMATAEEISASAQLQSSTAKEVATLASNLSEIVETMKISVTKFKV